MITEYSSIRDLHVRLTKLERQNWWMKRVLIALLACAVVTCVVAAQGRDGQTVEGERLVLRDRNKQIRVDLNANGPFLKYYDERGLLRAELFGSHLKFFDEMRTTRAEFFGGHLKFFDDAGKTRAEFFPGHLKVFDPNESQRAELFGSHFKLIKAEQQVFGVP